MANLWRLRAAWSGAGVVGPGLSTFYFTSSMIGGSDDVQAFFQAIKANIPSSVTIVVPADGDIIEDTTGELIGTWSEPGTGGTTVGTFAGDFARGVGARVRWTTAGVYRGRRVKGTTFLVPIGSALFGLDGLLDPATQTALQTAASALVTAQPELRIWSRPVSGVGATPGESNAITSAAVPNTVTWLRSRRT